MQGRTVRFIPLPGLASEPFEVELGQGLELRRVAAGTLAAAAAATPGAGLAERLAKRLPKALANRAHPTSTTTTTTPRLFLVRPDGTGIELLRPVDVCRDVLAGGEERACKVFEVPAAGESEELVYASFVQAAQLQGRPVSFYKQVSCSVCFL